MFWKILLILLNILLPQVVYPISLLLLLILVVPNMSRISCVPMSLLVQLTTPAAVPQTIKKDVSIGLETGLCQEIMISWYTQPEKPHFQQCML